MEDIHMGTEGPEVCTCATDTIRISRPWQPEACNRLDGRDRVVRRFCTMPKRPVQRLAINTARGVPCQMQAPACSPCPAGFDVGCYELL